MPNLLSSWRLLVTIGQLIEFMRTSNDSCSTYRKLLVTVAQLTEFTKTSDDSCLTNLVHEDFWWQLPTYRFHEEFCWQLPNLLSSWKLLVAVAQLTEFIKISGDSCPALSQSTGRRIEYPLEHASKPKNITIRCIFSIII